MSGEFEENLNADIEKDDMVTNHSEFSDDISENISDSGELAGEIFDTDDNIEDIPEDVDDETNEIMEDGAITIEEDICTIEKNGYEFKVNENGQLMSASGDLRLEEGIRDSKGQLEAGDTYRHEDDDGGHLIGARFGGPGEKEFLVPQERHVNRANYKSLENEWADALEDGNNVRVDINPIYHGQSKRPDTIMGSYEVSNGDKSETEYFSMTNENLDSEEFALSPEVEDDDYPNAMNTVTRSILTS